MLKSHYGRNGNETITFQRGVIKHKFTNLQKFAESINMVNLSQLKEYDITVRIKTLQRITVDLKNIQDSIISKCTES